MDDSRIATYDRFEASLRRELIKLCTEYEMMNGQLLHSDDIDAKWDEFVAEIGPAAKVYSEHMQKAVVEATQKFLEGQK